MILELSENHETLLKAPSINWDFPPHFQIHETILSFEYRSLSYWLERRSVYYLIASFFLTYISSLIESILTRVELRRLVQLRCSSWQTIILLNYIWKHVFERFKRITLLKCSWGLAKDLRHVWYVIIFNVIFFLDHVI